MAQLGFRTIDEMVGRVDRLEPRRRVDHWKAKGLDFSTILYQPEVGPTGAATARSEQDHGLEKSLDVDRCCSSSAEPALERGEPVRRAADPQRQPRGRHDPRQRGHAQVRRGRAARRHDPLHFTGSAGQSFGAFVPRGHDAVARGRRQRLRRQGPVGRQDHRLPAGRLDVRGRGERHHRQRGALRRDRRRGLHPRHGRRALLRAQQRRVTRSSRPWATTAAST